MVTGTTTRHVMFVISGLERGGAENQLVTIAAGLSERGWNVTVLSYLPFSPDSWASELQGTDIRLFTLNASSGMLKYAGLLGALMAVKRFRPRHSSRLHVSRHHDGPDRWSTYRSARNRVFRAQRA